MKFVNEEISPTNLVLIQLNEDMIACAWCFRYFNEKKFKKLMGEYYTEKKYEKYCPHCYQRPLFRLIRKTIDDDEKFVKEIEDIYMGIYKVTIGWDSSIKTEEIVDIQ